MTFHKISAFSLGPGLEENLTPLAHLHTDFEGQLRQDFLTYIFFREESVKREGTYLFKLFLEVLNVYRQLDVLLASSRNHLKY